MRCAVKQLGEVFDLVVFDLGRWSLTWRGGLGLVFLVVSDEVGVDRRRPWCESRACMPAVQ